MANRDYAAGIDPKHRLSVWDEITKSLSLKTDWGSAPPLTAGLRERFPDLLQSSVPFGEPPIPDTLRPGQRMTIFSSPQHDQADNSHHIDENERLRSDVRRTIIQGGVRYQRSTRRRPSQPAHPQPTPHQQRNHEPHPVSAELPRARVHSAIWNADLYEDPRRAPAPPSHATPTHPQWQDSTSCGIHQAITNVPHFSNVRHRQLPPRTHTIRRVPVQSSLRNQVHQDKVHHTEARHTSNTSDCTPPARYYVAPTISQPVGYSHFPVYSPLPYTEPHTLPPPHLRSSAGRHASTYAPQHSIVSSLESHTRRDESASYSTQTLAELQGSMPFSPPFAHMHPSSLAGMSDTSLATFENPDAAARPPLTRHEANVEALKQKLGVTGWKAKAVQMGKSVKRGVALLFDQGVGGRFHGRILDWVLGPGRAGELGNGGEEVEGSGKAEGMEDGTDD